MTTFFDYFTLISDTTRTTEKVGIMCEMLNEHGEFAYDVFRFLLDNSITTYITKFPVPNPDNAGSNISFKDVIYHHLNGQPRLSKKEWEVISSTFSKMYSPEEYKWIGKILTKDLNIGMSYATFNKGLAKSELKTKKPIKEYTTVKVSNIDEADINPERSYVGIKKDGANATAYNGAFISRKGNFIPIKHLEEAILPLKNSAVLFGELVSSDRQSSNGLVNSAIQLGYDSELDFSNMQFHVFDTLTVDEYEALYNDGVVPSRPFSQRIEDAKNIVISLNSPHVVMVEQILVDSFAEVIAIYEESIRRGEEGIIWNDASMLFELKRSKRRARIKEFHEGDFEIVSVSEHKHGGRVGSFLIKTSCGHMVCSVGSGIKKDESVELWNKRETLVGRIIKCKYNKVIPHAIENDKFSLFLPTLEKDAIRFDKDVADELIGIEWGNEDADKKQWLKNGSRN